MDSVSYASRGKNNPFDAYMAGFCLWMTPRQIIIVEKMCNKFINCLDGVEKEAFLDFKEQIEYEAEIKKKKYLVKE